MPKTDETVAAFLWEEYKSLPAGERQEAFRTLVTLSDAAKAIKRGSPVDFDAIRAEYTPQSAGLIAEAVTRARRKHRTGR